MKNLRKIATLIVLILTITHSVYTPSDYSISLTNIFDLDDLTY